jgi:hypothetical protein
MKKLLSTYPPHQHDEDSRLGSDKKHTVESAHPPGKQRLLIWVNKINPHTDLPPFLTRQSHERFTLLRMAAV